jgi:hypothetical protein
LGIGIIARETHRAGKPQRKSVCVGV